jgi:hypothetical protein
VVEETLRDLRFNNPRDPFPPSAQYVHEMCVKVDVNWRRRMLGYYFGKYGEVGHWHQAWGPAPDQSGFRVSAQTIAKWVRDNGALPNSIIELSDEQFAALPEWIFGVGEREKILADRKRWFFQRLQDRVAGHFLGRQDRYESGPQDGWRDTWGPAPLQPGCKAPNAVVIEALRDFMHAHSKDLGHWLKFLSNEKFNAIPVAAFPEGVRERSLAERETMRREIEQELQGRARAALVPVPHEGAIVLAAVQDQAFGGPEPGRS